MAQTFRFGIIGCGLMGREFASAAARWCHLTEDIARPQIVAVCDPVPAATEWFTTHFDVHQVTADYRELLVNPDIDAVYCAVPHDLHEEIYIEALKSGKHLFAEKPYGIDLAAAENIERERAEHPDLIVRCSSEFPFYPAVQRLNRWLQEERFGKLIEWRSGFLHSSDLDPAKPINWKRRVATCGEYGCMGDLGLHVVHIAFRNRLIPVEVYSLLTRVHEQRPDGKGGYAECETWDNAVLNCKDSHGTPLIFETKRISPGDANSWYIRALGTKGSIEFSTKYPTSLRVMEFESGKPQSWQEVDVKHDTLYKTITGPIFEFGFSDSILQMWASFLDELSGNEPRFRCATPEEALMSHRLFTSALKSHATRSVVPM